MHLTAERDALASAFDALGLVVEGKVVIPVLGSVAMTAENGTLRLCTSNLDQCVSATIIADVKDTGDGCIPFQALAGLVRGSAKGTHAKIVATDTTATISIGRSRYQLGVLPTTDFPPMLTPQAPSVFECNVGDLKKLVDSASYAVNPADTRPFVSNVGIDGSDDNLAIVCSDGHQMAVATYTTPVPFGRILLTPKVMKDILSLTNDVAQFSVGENAISVVAGGRTYAAKLSTGELPPYQRLISPIPENGSLVDSAELLSALRRLRTITDNNKNSGAVKVSWGDGKLTLNVGKGEQSGEEEMEIDAPGSAEFACNINYLYDAVDHMDSDTLRLHNGGAGSAIHILPPTNASRHFVIMPMRW